MENQKTGFIPLYRSVLKKPWAKDVFLRTLWENLLLGAARQPYTANFKGRQWPLQTGQLVTTTADLGLKLPAFIMGHHCGQYHIPFRAGGRQRQRCTSG